MTWARRSRETTLVPDGLVNETENSLSDNPSRPQRLSVLATLLDDQGRELGPSQPCYAYRHAGHLFVAFRLPATRSGSARHIRVTVGGEVQHLAPMDGEGLPVLSGAESEGLLTVREE